jgi:hypothetical protein
MLHSLQVRYLFGFVILGFERFKFTFSFFEGGSKGIWMCDSIQSTYINVHNPEGSKMIYSKPSTDAVSAVLFLASRKSW